MDAIHNHLFSNWKFSILASDYPEQYPPESFPFVYDSSSVTGAVRTGYAARPSRHRDGIHSGGPEDRFHFLQQLDRLGNNTDKHVHLTVNEAADYLQVSRASIYRWVAERYIPHAKVGGKLRFRLDVLAHWMERLSQKGRLSRYVVDR